MTWYGGNVQSLEDRINVVAHTISRTTEKGFLEKDDIKNLEKSVGELKIIGKEVHGLKRQLETVKIAAEEEFFEITNALKDEIKDLKERLKTVESEAKALQTQVKELLAENGELEGKNMHLEEIVENLKGKNMHLEGKNMHLEERVENLEEEVKHLKDEVSKVVSSNAYDELVLGQLCQEIQSMIFKKVLPPSEYSEIVSYNLKNMEQEIVNLGEVEAIEYARKAWAKLKQELEYQEEDIRRVTYAIGKVKSKRNVTAHPHITEAILIDTVDRMENEGKLKGMSYKNVIALISLWRKLTEMK